MEELVENFKNLGGSTIGEHKRNFNGFCKKLDGISEGDINLLILKLKPKYLQEKIFYVHLLGRFKKIEKLYEIFYQNNVVLNKIILKHYSREFLQELEATRFVNEVCPKISYSMRMRIINKLSRQICDTAKADEFFKEIFVKYGPYCPERIYTNCSLDLINHYMRYMKVRGKGLIKLHKKSSKMLEKYLDSNDFPLSDWILLMRYLAANDVDTFYKILNEHLYFYNIPNDKKFLNLINKLSLTKAEFNMFLKIILEGKLVGLEEFDAKVDVYSIIIPFMKIIPIKDRASIFFEKCSELKNKGTLTQDHVNQLLPLLPLEDRLKFPITLKNNLKFFDTKQAFEYVQQNISLFQDVNVKSALLANLIESCKINCDYNILLEVLKYFFELHKDEVIHVHEAFVKNVLDSFKTSLNRNHWYYLNEIVLNIRAKKGNINCECDYLVAYIYYKISHNINFTNELKKFMQVKEFNSWRILEKFSWMEKVCLMKMRDFIEEIFKEKDIIEAKTTFIITLIEWNDSHPRKSFDLYKYPDCIEALITSVLKDDYPDKLLLKAFLTKNPRNYRERDNLLTYYIKNTKKSVPQDLFSWLIKHNPALVEIFLDELLDTSFSSFPFYQVVKMHWNGFSDLVKIKVIKNFNNEYQETFKRYQVLHYLCYEDDFLHYFKRYLISKETSNFINFTKKDKEEIQREILVVLKKCLSLHEILETLLNFCTGIYTLEQPLCYIFNNTPEKDIEKPLSILSNHLMSVRKYAVDLAVQLLPNVLVHELLSDMCASEKNAPLRKYLRNTAKKYVLGHACDCMYALFKSQVRLIPVEDDNETGYLLVLVTEIPEKFFVDYFVFIWNRILAHKSGKNHLQFYLLDYFIQTISNKEDFRVLSDEFCKDVINYCLFNPYNCNCSDIEKFVYYFLKYGHGSTYDRLSFLREKISNYKSSIVGNDGHFEVPQNLTSLVNTLCSLLKEK